MSLVVRRMRAICAESKEEVYAGGLQPCKLCLPEKPCRFLM